MSSRTVLRGIAWNHSRAFPPVVATAQRFGELHPEVDIRWEKHSLHNFGHADLASLAGHYDLLVIDHPAIGEVYNSHTLVDLSESFGTVFLEELAADSCGRSFESYSYQGRVFALPIDAAAPAASYRLDLLQRANAEIPQTWNEVLSLARKNLVVMPGFHADVFLNFMGICASLGTNIGVGPEELVDFDTSRQCLELLRELASYMPTEIYDWNPIAVYENMSASDLYAFCPFAFSYSNYSRAGFAKNLILFSNPVPLVQGRLFRSVLGGTGIAISASCKSPEVALDYIRQLTGETWQHTLYGLSGGQPARRSSWKDETLNQVTNGFFSRTLESVERAYMRPRYPGYVEFQGEAGVPLVQYLQGKGTPASALEQLNSRYRRSQKKATLGNKHDA
jgi:multiple sugar transport system substrate-binding protein